MSAAPADGCAWITGASSGLGRALALRLAAEGRTVAVSARRGEALAALADESAARGLPGRIVPFPVDVTDVDAVRRTVAAIETDLAPIGTAVLNAGTHQPMGARDFAAGTVRTLFAVNVFGVAHGLDAVLPGMIGRRSGRIALTASLAGYVGLPGAAGYCATKAALIAMAEALRPELDAYGVTLQLVNPGFVRTPLTDRNTFPMPFLMDVEAAAAAFARGLQSDRFEIVFPRRLAVLLRLLRLLPYPVAFAATRRMVSS